MRLLTVLILVALLTGCSGAADTQGPDELPLASLTEEVDALEPDMEPEPSIASPEAEAPTGTAELSAPAEDAEPPAEPEICFPDYFLTWWEAQPAWMYAPDGVELRNYPDMRATVQQESDEGQLVRVLTVVRMINEDIPGQLELEDILDHSWALIARVSMSLYDCMGWVKLNTLEKYWGGEEQPIDGPIKLAETAILLDPDESHFPGFTPGIECWAKYPFDPAVDWVEVHYYGQFGCVLKTDVLLPVVDNDPPYDTELKWYPYTE